MFCRGVREPSKLQENCCEKALEKGKGRVYNHPSPKQVVRLERSLIFQGMPSRRGEFRVSLLMQG